MKSLVTLLVLTFFIAPVAHAFVDQQETTLQCAVNKDLETKAGQELPLFAITGGFLDGILNEAWSLLNGTATLIFHPIQAYKSLTAVTASQLANAVYEGLKGRVCAVVEVDPNSFISIYNASYAVGQTTFDVCTIGVGVAVKGTQVAKVSVDVSNAANRAAEIAKIAQVLKAIKIGEDFGALGSVIANQAGKIILVTDYAKARMLERSVTLAQMNEVVATPLVRLSQSGGKTLYLNEKVVVVLDSAGSVVTTYSRPYFEQDILNILSRLGK